MMRAWQSSKGFRTSSRFLAFQRHFSLYPLQPPLASLGIISKNATQRVHHNLNKAQLYEIGLQTEDVRIVSSGAMSANSGVKTGRSPKDKRIVDDSTSNEVWWGDVNMKASSHQWQCNRQSAVDYLGSVENLFVVDGFINWDASHRVKVRVIASRAYHALFMRNMMIRPTKTELREFGEPDFTILNAGGSNANKYVEGNTSQTSICLNLTQNEAVILGTEYAGCMKKGLFTLMHYLAPKNGCLSLHSSANEGKNGDVSLFFGLSGTGKTTLSADNQRLLIGDDEHVWTDNGVYNIEGGCYAKAVGLSEEAEPDIYRAIRFGAILENIVADPETAEVDFSDTTLTENTRLCYPIEYMPSVKLPCVGGHPKNIIFLTCDAFGVLPPVSKLSPEQAMYHFISGYTSKVAGTEMGVTEPQTTFSACFGEAFLIRHPAVYAEMLAKKMKEHGSNCWLVNTGWTGGAAGEGKRIPLRYTRSIIDAIHDENGQLDDVEYSTLPGFNFEVPNHVEGVPDELLKPRQSWTHPEEYDNKLALLAGMFVNNFEKYSAEASESIKAAGPNW